MRACSISRAVQDALPLKPAVGEVLATFQRACIFWIGPDRLTALVAPELDNGPLNIVLESSPEWYPGLLPGTPVQIDRDCLRVCGLEVWLDGAVCWEPRPDWSWLRARSKTILRRQPRLLAQVENSISGESLLSLVTGAAKGGSIGVSRGHIRAREAAEALLAGWHGDEAQLGAGAARLAGLGEGLTPAGDDFILGVMLCAWLAHPDPGRYCQPLLDSCSPRTTRLSVAFLRSAAAGECSAAWHRLLEVMPDGTDEQLGRATREVLSSGHSSGADTLAGFLWIALRLGTE